jgi:ribose transport system substrate-binding protein
MHLHTCSCWTHIALGLAVLLAGCARQTTDRDATSAGPAQPAIGVSLLTLQNPFFAVIGDNITAEAQKHGYRTIVLSADRDVVKQANQVKDFIVQRVSAIVLSPCEADSIGPVIQEANAAGVPVFTVDIPCRLPDVKIECQIATDNEGGGREAARAMIEALGEAGGKVAVIHFKQAESCRLRVQGFRAVIDQHNANSPAKISIVAELEGGGLKDPGYKAAEDVLQTHPDLAGIFAINDPSALGARAALEKAGKADQVVIVGFDGQPEGRQAIKDGKIYADPIQFPDQMGIQIVEAIVKHSRGEELPAEVLIPTKLYRREDALHDPELR